MKTMAKNLFLFMIILSIGLAVNWNINEYIDRYTKDEPIKKVIVYKKVYIKVPQYIRLQQIPTGEVDSTIISNQKVVPAKKSDTNLYRKSQRFHKTGLISSIE